MPGRPGDPANSRYIALSAADRTGEGYAASYTSWAALVIAEGIDFAVTDETQIVEGFADFGASGLVETISRDLAAYYSNGQPGRFLWIRSVVGAEVFNKGVTIGDYTTHFHIERQGNNDLFTNFPDYGRITHLSCASGHVTIESPRQTLIDKCMIEVKDTRPAINMNFGEAKVWNSVVIASKPDNGRECIYRHRIDSPWTEIKNNLLITYSTLSGFICLEVNKQAVISNNIAIVFGAGPICYDVSDHTEFSNNASNDATANNPVGAVGSIINFNPATEIEDIDNNDFHLTAGSQFIGAGKNWQSDFQDDFEEDPRPSDSSAWSIGNDEPEGLAPVAAGINSLLLANDV